MRSAVFHSPQPLNLEAIKARRRAERLARVEGEQRQMLTICQAVGLPPPKFEFRFCARLWRLDYAWLEWLVCIEQDGGLFVGGKHTQGAGIVKDQHKRNTAIFMGWALFVFTPSQMRKGAWVPWVQRTIERRKGGR